ncbi:PRC-barrel domain-containing protein [Sporosarcina trichiuri]|uniref:PRC-barrel domain-containing protein n=1 Tax=Sporosarcina trichiuri TaxID=3056445 RepID=UPI0025B4661B|nr:YlmC/YmxH family sporulation protein [Sporosarcina sp. 0.2-SM1T-5]WJY28807.1 YlmC/YmxH family sporulation protein [Sporosarcina sp. 0.2-SM1T-5]
MRFSEIQKKEVIDLNRGKFLGFVQDASIDITDGKIQTLHIGGTERSLFMESRVKDQKQVRYEEVVTIGKDIVLIQKKLPPGMTNH